MEWERVESAFDWDGSWRDLYVLDASLDAWQRLLDFLKSGPYGLTFRRETVEPLPARASSAFGGPDDVRPLLHVDLGSVTLNCHFFAEDEVEFDLDPREVQSGAEAESVFEFMRGVGRALGKPVRLTPESMSDLTLIEYDPASDELRKVREFRGLL